MHEPKFSVGAVVVNLCARDWTTEHSRWAWLQHPQVLALPRKRVGLICSFSTSFRREEFVSSKLLAERMHYR